MSSYPSIQPTLETVIAGLPRGVYRFIAQPSGVRYYLLKTSTGEVVAPLWRTVYPDERSAFLERDLWTELHCLDPLSITDRPTLSVVAGDGPPSVASRRPRRCRMQLVRAPAPDRRTPST